MSSDNKAYLSRRERDHRAQADAAKTDKVKQVHLVLAEQYATKAGEKVSLSTK